MKFLFLSTIFYQVLYPVKAEPFGSWTSPGMAFTFGATSGSPPPVAETQPAPQPAPPPPPAVDTFESDKEPKLTILYDAMDEKSQILFNTTLVKQYSVISPYIHIDFNPCLRAELEDGTSGDVVCAGSFDTHCQLDKVHTCAILQITNKTQLVDYLACTMISTTLSPNLSNCGFEYKIDMSKLNTCASSPQGLNTCKDFSGRKFVQTSGLPLFFFKNINDIPCLGDQTLENLDLYRSCVCANDLMSGICAKIVASKAAKVPDECKKKLVIGIFYKVMEEKSQKWFHLLDSVFDKFSSYFVFNFQPCYYADLNSGDRLDCKDANDEGCVAGKTHACAIKLAKDPKSLFKFLCCTMQSTAKLPDFHKCAADNKLPYDDIKKCVDGEDGKLLCTNYGKMRVGEEGSLPSFSFELTFNDDTSNKVANATDLNSVFCEQFKKYGVLHPPDCQ